MEIDPNSSNRKNKNNEISLLSLIDGRTNPELPTDQIKNAVFFLILKMVNNKNESEKLTDKVFKEAKSQLSPHIYKHNFSSWLFQLASKKAKEYLLTKKNKEIAAINQSNFKSKNDKKRLNQLVQQFKDINYCTN